MRSVRLLLLILVQTLSGQTPNASLIGTVTDASSAVMMNAGVKLINLDTNVEKATTTSNVGQYQFATVQPGRYKLEFTATNFKTHLVNEVVFRVGDQKRIDITLQAGEARESLTVTDEAPLTETERATATTVVNERSIQDLPLNG